MTSKNSFHRVARGSKFLLEWVQDRVGREEVKTLGIENSSSLAGVKNKGIGQKLSGS